MNRKCNEYDPTPCGRKQKTISKVVLKFCLSLYVWDGKKSRSTFLLFRIICRFRIYAELNFGITQYRLSSFNKHWTHNSRFLMENFWYILHSRKNANRGKYYTCNDYDERCSYYLWLFYLSASWWQMTQSSRGCGGAEMEIAKEINSCCLWGWLSFHP